MGWQDTTIIMLRILINDDDCANYEYSDNRLLTVLGLAAHYVNSEIDFGTTYTVDVLTPSISPDPTSIPDEDFLNFVVLKAACIIDRGNMRVAAMSAGVEARCGPAVMRTLRRMDAFKTLIDNGFCAAYEQLRLEYKTGTGRSIRAVLSPFVNKSFDPESYGTDGYNERYK